MLIRERRQGPVGGVSKREKERRLKLKAAK